MWRIYMLGILRFTRNSYKGSFAERIGRAAMPLCLSGPWNNVSLTRAVIGRHAFSCMPSTRWTEWARKTVRAGGAWRSSSGYQSSSSWRLSRGPIMPTWCNCAIVSIWRWFSCVTQTGDDFCWCKVDNAFANLVLSHIYRVSYKNINFVVLTILLISNLFPRYVSFIVSWIFIFLEVI